MASRNASALLVVLFISILVLPACAHAPLNAGESGELFSAVLIAQPEKSYVIYGHLHEPGDIAYYRFDMAAGQTLHVALLVNSRSTSAPDLIIMGPGIPSFGTPQNALQTPPGGGVVVIPGRLPERAEYEPFSPAALYQVASYTTQVPATGTYYVAVSASAGEQDYSLAPGFLEEFTASEWLAVPVSVIGGHTWEGQSAAIVLAPCIAFVLLGIALLVRRQKRTGTSLTLFSWLATLAGLLYLGGACVTSAQMVRALSITGWDNSAIVTLFFILIPVLLGVLAVRTGIRSGPSIHTRERLIMAVTGLLGLVFWAGLIIGPVIALVAVVMPESTKQRV